MTKIINYIYLFYTVIVNILLFLTLIFFGILADEGVKYEKFAKVYTLGIEFNYSFLNFFLIFTLIISLFLSGYQIIRIMNRNRN